MQPKSEFLRAANSTSASPRRGTSIRSFRSEAAPAAVPRPPTFAEWHSRRGKSWLSASTRAKFIDDADFWSYLHTRSRLLQAEYFTLYCSQVHCYCGCLRMATSFARPAPWIQWRPSQSFCSSNPAEPCPPDHRPAADCAVSRSPRRRFRSAPSQSATGSRLTAASNTG